MDKINEGLAGIDADEETAHKKVWMKRGQLIVKQGRLIMGIRTQLTNIVECTDYFESDESVDQEQIAQRQSPHKLRKLETRDRHQW